MNLKVYLSKLKIYFTKELIVNKCSCPPNAGVLQKQSYTITIRKNNWLDRGNSNPMLYSKPIAFTNQNVYFLYRGGKKGVHGVHISLNFWEKQKFLWLQNKHFLQGGVLKDILLKWIEKKLL